MRRGLNLGERENESSSAQTKELHSFQVPLKTNSSGAQYVTLQIKN
jgi:hypothetical protein